MSERDSSDRLTHLDDDGNARMVDVGDKAVTARRAVATGSISMEPRTLAAIRDGDVPKGDVLAVARIAAIQAVKNTAHWIPLCHPLPIDGVKVDLDVSGEDKVTVTAEVRVTARTGVEMEALTAVSAGLLTIYDMCKALDRGMVLGSIQLEQKEGGRSGSWQR